MATSERYKGKDGEWQERTEWHSVVVWGGRGESLSKMISKGSLVFVEGRNATRSWDGKNGKQYKTEVHCEQITMCGDGRARSRETDEPEETDHKEQDPTELDD